MCALVRSGEVPGLLAYRDSAPVGWVSVAPREQFASLLRSPQYRLRDDDTGVFVITCLAVDRELRGQGIGAALVGAAVEYATVSGAIAVEASPKVPPDYKGTLAWFLDYGFDIMCTAGSRTVVPYTP